MSLSKRLVPSVVGSVLCLTAAGGICGRTSDRPAASTAWKDGKFQLDVPGVIRRSDILLQAPNTHHEEAMPLGNGQLGLAVWAENGLTMQLNRADTLPLRWSPGQVVIPGLKKLAQARDFAGKLDLYDGEFSERGGGMSATAYVQPGTDIAVVDITGADPNTVQTAKLFLWPARHPAAHAQQQIGALSETWKDDQQAGASGETFGSLAAITADGRGLHAEVLDPLTVQVSFRPKADGSFRVFIAAPHWAGGDAQEKAARMLPAGFAPAPAEHAAWWHHFWANAGAFRMSSSDGSAEYMENLRAIDLYTAAAERGTSIPGSQAGIGDLFSSIQDKHQWGPPDYWHWNLRMQVAANLGAGAYALNDSYFSLYRKNLPSIEAWTKQHMGDRPGVCVPETMRFNGMGYENESWLKGSAPLNCAADSKPYYNARTLSTGAEVSLWIWEQYLATRDRAFLAANFPVMEASARFLLSYAKQGSDGLLHTYPSNAHETQWDVHDPTTDLAAMKALFPAVLQAAQLLGTDPELVASLKKAMMEVRGFPRIDPRRKVPVVIDANDRRSDDVIASSYDPAAPVHNTENIGLEPVWPYSLIGDDGPLHALGVRTFMNRPNKEANDWSLDPIQAARLGLADEVKRTLLGLTEKYQAYPSGLAAFVGPDFYVEQAGVVAAALQEAMVQDYDGVIRIGPAWPPDWQADAQVYVRNRSKVDVQVDHGRASLVVFEAGFTGSVQLRNPWPGRRVNISVGEAGRGVTAKESSKQILQLNVQAGQAYRLGPADVSATRVPFLPVSGSPASSPKHLGSRSIGLARAAQ